MLLDKKITTYFF